MGADERVVMVEGCFDAPGLMDGMVDCYNLLPQALRDVASQAISAGHEKLHGCDADIPCAEVFAVASFCLDAALPHGAELAQLMAEVLPGRLGMRERLLDIMYPIAAALICAELHRDQLCRQL